MIEYVGENLWIGKLGNFFVVLAFICAAFASLSYFLSVQRTDEAWKRVARNFFYAHAIAVFCIVGLLFYMLLTHMFEYYYIWQHSNRAMPLRFIFSCFWEGQEGSFLLWTFWHAVIGLVLLRSTREWEAPVMSVVALVQAVLGCMVLGIYVFEYKIGSNPFTVLTREHPDFAGAPFTQIPDYLMHLDGRGLNPLLQNYWMVIHPPTLFLGFALTLVPFAYAISGLWLKRLGEWQKSALPWTFFGVMVLGTGILMGGAWAYEALSFGGFWAWDPVENASLVPWLLLVAGAHVMLINKNKGQSLLSSFLLIIFSFILILYSTFLTRSGILGDTSVHSFTDLGMSGLLLMFLFLFLGLSIFLLVKNYRHFPKEEEESVWSREFWMFIGALVLALSSFQIIFTTSYPVINKVFGTSLAIGAGDAIRHYNKWQIPFAVLVTLLIAVGQYFKFRKTDPAQFFRNMRVSFISALVISLLTAFFFGWLRIGIELLYAVMLFSCVFAVAANLDYFIRIIKGRLDHAGASIAHAGFGLLLLGALISTGKSEIISQSYDYDVEFLGKGFSNNENVLLVKDDTVKMGEYYVAYRGRRQEGIHLLYDVEYMKKDSLTGKYTSQFNLTPFIQLNKQMGNAAEPDTRHFIHKDVYTHVMYADVSDVTGEKPAAEGQYGEPQNKTVKVGDTILTFKAILVLEQLVQISDSVRFPQAELAVGARIRAFDFNKKEYEIMPVYAIEKGFERVIEDSIPGLGLKVAMWHISPETQQVDISYSEKNTRQDFIVMKAVVFPGINILWSGCIIMIIGTILAIRHRLKKRAS
ncbi:MAG: cytochrome c biogenesis protein CcsA [Bacteroidota bacterium]